MNDQKEKDKKQTKDQDFIVETPIVIEEKIKNSDRIVKYERGKFLGKGGFAKCYEMKRVDSGKIYAAKVFEKKSLTNHNMNPQKLINEIKLHKKLHHPNIVNFEHFFEDKENVYILLELCQNQTLSEFVKRRKRLTEIEVQCYLIQIIKALKYIHSHRIIHRDLKPGNLFLTQTLELKLGDFGLAAKLEHEGQKMRTMCGTPNYIAPEILDKKNGYSYEVDIWSLGVLTYKLFYGKEPFEASDVELTYERIKMNMYSFPEGIKVSPSAKKLISSILVTDPSKRPSLENIVEFDFFKIYNVIPPLMPISTLACPPSVDYITSYKEHFNRGMQSLSPRKDERQIRNNSSSCRNKNILGAYNSDDNLNNYDVENDETLLKRLGDGENGNFLNNNTLTNKIGSTNCILKFFDYSTKFGFVYFINNTHIGICFNDFSNILKRMNKDQDEQSLANTNNYDYIYLERDARATQNFDEIGLENYLGSKNTSQELIKKFDVFKRLVEKHLSDFEKVKKEKKNAVKGKNERLFFIKRFLISKTSILFRLSNKLVQIVFNDGTEIHFPTETNDIIYKNKKEEKRESIKAAMTGTNQDMIKKIKLAKGMLVSLVKHHNSKNFQKVA